MENTDSFLAALKASLLKIDEHIGDILTNYSGQVGGLDGISDYYFINGAAEFIEVVALETKQYEIAGICRSILVRRRQVESIEEDLENQRISGMRQDLWDSKELVNPTEIAGQLQPKDSWNAVRVNKFLETAGLIKRVSDGWVATGSAAPHAVQYGLEDGKKPYVRWRKSILEFIAASTAAIEGNS